MLVSLKCDKSHQLVDNALTVLENMKHRGSEAADNKSGDGAGILVQIPHEFILLQGIPVTESCGQRVWRRNMISSYCLPDDHFAV